MRSLYTECFCFLAQESTKNITISISSHCMLIRVIINSSMFGLPTHPKLIHKSLESGGLVWLSDCRRCHVHFWFGLVGVFDSISTECSTLGGHHGWIIGLQVGWEITLEQWQGWVNACKGRSGDNTFALEASWLTSPKLRKVNVAARCSVV